MIKPDQEDFQHLMSVLERYQADIATIEEREFVERYLQMLEFRSPVPKNFELTKSDIERDINNHLFTQIAQERQAEPPAIHRVHFLRRYWWAAAVIAVIASAGGYMLMRNLPQEKQIAAQMPTDIVPGKNGAVLTLSNGRQVLLDSMADGQVAVQSGTALQMQNGSLQYEHRTSEGEVGYNTISTPKGRQFRVVLPDGSAVWLNAASSITYATRFDGPERLVKVEGEAYFEVAPKVHQPFKVKVNDRAEVVVLGTSFNVNAYQDESAIRTTLLSGSVKVLNTGNSKVIVPGQQASIQVGSLDISVGKVNTGEVIAWKNGSFAFAGADIQSVMRQLARWYNIEVRYNGEIPQGTFSGEIDRSLTLTQVLNGLTATRIRYRLEPGNKLVILP